MKKFLSILLAALCALLPTLALAQESTTLQVTVPAEHTITVICGAHGKAVINGKAYSGTFTLQAARLDTLVIKAKPNSGYGLSQIQVDDLDGVTVKGRKVTLSSIHCENTVTLTFCKLPAEATPAPTVTPDPTADSEPASPGTVTLPEIPLTGNSLYDDLLGTGNGLGQLSIVYNSEYQPQDYELLNIRSDHANQKNTVLVRTCPDESGAIARRSLILSATQLTRLVQKQQTEQLIFENGEAAAVIQLNDLLGGDVYKLMGLLLQAHETVTPETLKRDWSDVPTVALTADELDRINVEVRITPAEQADAAMAYALSVHLRFDDQELDISSMLPSLQAALRIDTESVDAYAVGYQEENAGDFQPLDSTLVQIPETLPEDQPDEAAKFVFTMSEDGSAPVTVYNEAAPLSQERHGALAVTYAGTGFYQLLNVE